MKIYLLPITSLIALALTGHPTSWKNYQSKSGRFAVMLPGRPVSQAMSINTPSGPLELRIFASQPVPGSTSFGVGYGDLPRDLALKRPASVTLDGARNGAVANIHGRLLSSRNITLAGHPGREFRARVASGIYASRIYLVGQRLYQVIATTPQEQADSTDVARFMTSFKVLPQR
jgi:hypothetical protein